MRGDASATSRRRWFVPGGRCGASARRRADAKVVRALDASIRTSDRALREVERLKRQRRILAQHVAIHVGQIALHRRIIASLRVGGEASQAENLCTIKRRDEEIDHLRFEVDALSARLREYSASMGKDADSILQESWEMAKRLRAANIELERLRFHRRIMASHMREALCEARLWRKWVESICPRLDMPGIGVQACAVAISHAFKWALTRIERLILSITVGRRNAPELQEALDG